MKIILLLICLFPYSNLLVASEKEKTNEASEARCHVKVHVVHKSGRSFDHHFAFRFDTREDCDAAAKKHETNINPSIIEKVTVEHEWK